MKLLWIALFGLLGVFARYGVGVLVSRFSISAFPYATLVINLTGAFLIGIVYVVGVEQGRFSLELTTGVMVGFLGGFTTFSSYCLEASRLLEQRLFFAAGFYFCLSPILGLVAAFSGIFLSRALLR